MWENLSHGTFTSPTVKWSRDSACLPRCPGRVRALAGRRQSQARVSASRCPVFSHSQPQPAGGAAQPSGILRSEQGRPTSSQSPFSWNQGHCGFGVVGGHRELNRCVRDAGVGFRGVMGNVTPDRLPDLCTRLFTHLSTEKNIPLWAEAEQGAPEE